MVKKGRLSGENLSAPQNGFSVRACCSFISLISQAASLQTAKTKSLSLLDNIVTEQTASLTMPLNDASIISDSLFAIIPQLLRY